MNTIADVFIAISTDEGARYFGGWSLGLNFDIAATSREIFFDGRLIRNSDVSSSMRLPCEPCTLNVQSSSVRAGSYLGCRCR